MDSTILLSIKCIMLESNSDHCSKMSGILGAVVGFGVQSHPWSRLPGLVRHPSQ